MAILLGTCHSSLEPTCNPIDIASWWLGWIETEISTSSRTNVWGKGLAAHVVLVLHRFRATGVCLPLIGKSFNVLTGRIVRCPCRQLHQPISPPIHPYTPSQFHHHTDISIRCTCYRPCYKTVSPSSFY